MGQCNRFLFNVGWSWAGVALDAPPKPSQENDKDSDRPTGPTAGVAMQTVTKQLADLKDIVSKFRHVAIGDRPAEAPPEPAQTPKSAAAQKGLAAAVSAVMTGNQMKGAKKGDKARAASPAKRAGAKQLNPPRRMSVEASKGPPLDSDKGPFEEPLETQAKHLADEMRDVLHKFIESKKVLQRSPHCHTVSRAP